MGSQLAYTNTIPPIAYWVDLETVTLPSGSSVTPDTSYTVNNIVLTETTTINAPVSGAQDGQPLVLRFNRAAISSADILWDLKYMGSDSQELLTQIGGESDPLTSTCFYFEFRYNASSDTWDLMYYSSVPIILYTQIYTGPYNPEMGGATYGNNLVAAFTATGIAVATTGSNPNLFLLTFDDSATGTVDLSSLTNLYQFITYSNGITAITFPQSDVLTNIGVSNVPVTSLEVVGCEVLNVFNFMDLPSLTTVDLSNIGLATGWSMNQVGYSYGANNPSLVNLYVPASFPCYGVYLVDCALNSTSVNNLILALSASGLFSGTLNISGGTSASPSGSALAAKSTLEDRGWTVNTN
jgi:hypothetical protein